MYCGNNTISSLVGYEKHTISFLVGGGHFNLVTVLRLLMSQWSWFCIYSIICVIPTQYNNTATLLSLQNIVTGGVGGGGAGHYRKSVKRSTLYHLMILVIFSLKIVVIMIMQVCIYSQVTIVSFRVQHVQKQMNPQGFLVCLSWILERCTNSWIRSAMYMLKHTMWIHHYSHYWGWNMRNITIHFHFIKIITRGHKCHS